MRLRLIRVFPRRNKATPVDALACFGPPRFVDEADCFFAYDPGDPFETLRSAASRLIAAGFTPCSHRLRCYVLIGYPKDTFGAAEKRLQDMLAIGFTPHAMLWDPETPSAERYRPAPEWKRFQRLWARPAIIHHAQEMELDYAG